MKHIICVFTFLALLGAAISACDVVESWEQKDSDAEIPEEQREIEAYVVPFGYMGRRIEYMRLTTISRWEGNESRTIKYTAPQSPWVVNARCTSTSQIGSKFEVYVWEKEEIAPGVRQGAVDLTGRQGVYDGLTALVVEQSGEFIIEVQASGCEWWLKVGVE